MCVWHLLSKELCIYKVNKTAKLSNAKLHVELEPETRVGCQLFEFQSVKYMK